MSLYASKTDKSYPRLKGGNFSDKVKKTFKRFFTKSHIPEELEHPILDL